MRTIPNQAAVVETKATSTAREAMILQNLNQVQFLAKRLHSRLPATVAIDDLISVATIGLVQAANRFQPARGLRFRTYAERRSSGAMLDYLRREDPLTRG